MKRLLLLSTLLLTAISNNAQQRLAGKILDANTLPVAYANVVLMSNQDSQFVAGVTSDIDGKFIFNDLEDDQYLIEISFIGYDKLTELVTTYDLNEIQEFILQENATQLSEVLVKGKRKLISRKNDRLVVDVENSLRSNYGNAIDVLALTPGIRTQNNQLRIISKPSVEVFINGRPSNLSGESLISFLETLSSQSIKSIEVYSIPPSHLEVNGNAGVVNILLKEAVADSWKANFGAMYRKRTHYKTSINASFFYNKNKFSFSNSFYLQEGVYHQGQENSSFYDNENWFTDSSFDRKFLEYNSTLKLGYQLSPNYGISIQYLYSASDQSAEEMPFSNITSLESENRIGRLDSEGLIDQVRHIHALNLNQTISLDTSGKELTINLDYFNFKDLEDKIYDGTSLINSKNQFFRGNNINDQNIKNQSASYNFILPYSKVTLKTGGKLGRSTAKNTLRQANTGVIDRLPTALNLVSNDFEYDESVTSAYIVADPKLSNEWSLSLGLRFESIKIASQSNSLAISNEKTLNNFLPTIFLSKQLQERMSLGLSYNRRIARPSFYLITPNPWVTNPFNQVVGNPFLLPSFSNNLELNFTYKDFYSKLYYTNTMDDFSQVPITNEQDKIVVFQFINFPSKQNTGVSFNHSWEALSGWTMNNEIDFNYGRYIYEDITLTGFNTYLSTSHDLALNASRTLQMNISFWYAPRGVDEIWEVRPQSSLSSSLQYFMLDRKLSVGLLANDIFRNQNQSFYSGSQNVGQDVDVYYDSRFVSLSVNYNFGNAKLKTQNRKRGNTDEIRRTGN